jgi:hypothetical protein
VVVFGGKGEERLAISLDREDRERNLALFLAFSPSSINQRAFNNTAAARRSR